LQSLRAQRESKKPAAEWLTMARVGVTEYFTSITPRLRYYATENYYYPEATPWQTRAVIQKLK
jgi:hypothetical protein